MEAMETQLQPPLCVTGRAARLPSPGRLHKPTAEPATLLTNARLPLALALRIAAIYACAPRLEAKHSHPWAVTTFYRTFREACSSFYARMPFYFK